MIEREQKITVFDKVDSVGELSNLLLELRSVEEVDSNTRIRVETSSKLGMNFVAITIINRKTT